MLKSPGDLFFLKGEVVHFLSILNANPHEQGEMNPNHLRFNGTGFSN